MSDGAFGQMVRRLRIACGLSQNALARLSGIDPAYVNQIERGGQVTRKGKTLRYVYPSRMVVLALANALEVDDVQRDGLLDMAGFTSEVDWMSRAIRAEDTLNRIRCALHDDHPVSMVRLMEQSS